MGECSLSTRSPGSKMHKWAMGHFSVAHLLPHFGVDQLLKVRAERLFELGGACGECGELRLKSQLQTIRSEQRIACFG